jgi:hypothetical protein
VGLAAALALTAAGAARADDKADAKALIDKAIKAAGGEEKLAKFQAETFKGKGKFYGMGEGLDYTGEWAMQMPDKMRVQIEVAANGMKFNIVRVFNGEKAWGKFGDDVKEVDDKDELAEAREQAYAGWVATLTPLKDKGFEFATLGEVKIDGKAAVGVRVSKKDHRDVSLYFDKDKALLLKSEFVVKDDMTGGKEVQQEVLYGDYKEISGVQRPMKVVVNREGKKYVDLEIAEMEVKEKIDDSVFGKP